MIIDGSPGAPEAVSSREHVSRAPAWPLLLVSLIGFGALVVAFGGDFESSVVAYFLVLVLGCGLLFVHRVQVVAMTRRASRPAPSGVSRRERAAIVFLLAASLANGLVIGMDLARR